MTILHNLKEHADGIDHINAVHLLHFVADSVKDWECDCIKSECDKCPFGWVFTRMPEREEMKMCILEGIKDQAFVYLSPDSEKEPEAWE